MADYVLTPDQVEATGSDHAPQEPRLNIFLSHISQQQRFAEEVATVLHRFGIDLFVAHVSLEPDEIWRQEIYRQLDLAEGGVAFLHVGFRESDWCGQEVGWLLGRHVPVISVRFDMPPYGPIGERQAVPGHGGAVATAHALLDAILKRPELKDRATDALIDALRTSFSFDDTVRVWRHLRARELSAEQCAKLLAALEANPQVHNAHDTDDGWKPFRGVIRDFVASQPGGQAVIDRVASEGDRHAPS